MSMSVLPMFSSINFIGSNLTFRSISGLHLIYFGFIFVYGVKECSNFSPLDVSQSVSSVAQSCPTLCDPMNRSTPGLPVHHQLPEFRLTSIESVMPSSHLILCRPFLFLPPIPPRKRVFSNESTLHEVTKVLEFQLQHQSFQ